MSCPKCGGFVEFRDEVIAVEIAPEGGVWLYYSAECENGDWHGVGRWWCELSETRYEDDVDVPEDAIRVWE